MIINYRSPSIDYSIPMDGYTFYTCAIITDGRRIILVNKEDNESYLYKLDETDEILRNDRSISKIYNTGKLGGKPKIELDYE